MSVLGRQLTRFEVVETTTSVFEVYLLFVVAGRNIFADFLRVTVNPKKPSVIRSAPVIDERSPVMLFDTPFPGLHANLKRA